MFRNTYTRLTTTVENGLAIITMARGDGINAMEAEMYAEVRDAFREADGDPDVAAIIITSQEKMFAVGGDLKQMAGFLADENTTFDVYRFRDSLPFDAIRRCTKPTIAAVNGTAVGGGFAIAISCDFIVAATGVKIGVTETRVGLMDGLVPAVLFGHIPTPVLKYMMFAGKLITVERGVELGLVFETADPGDVMTRARDLASEVTANGPQIVAGYKAVLGGYERPVNYDETINVLYRNAEVQRKVLGFAGLEPDHNAEQATN